MDLFAHCNPGPCIKEASGLGLSEPGYPSSQHLEGRSPSETPNFCDLTCLILRKLPEGVVERRGFVAFLAESDSGAMGVEFGIGFLFGLGILRVTPTDGGPFAARKESALCRP